MRDAYKGRIRWYEGSGVCVCVCVYRAGGRREALRGGVAAVRASQSLPPDLAAPRLKA